MSDDAEHTLSKADVVLTFAVEVSATGGIIYHFRAVILTTTESVNH